MATTELFNKGNAPSQVQKEIRRLLEKFQEGYAKRDLTKVSNFVEELFVQDEDVIVIGTGDNEWCLGLDKIKNLVESDWKYWDNVVIDPNKAMISLEGDTAWLYVDALLVDRLEREKSEEEYLTWVLENIKKTADNVGINAKERLLKILNDGSWNLFQTDRKEPIVCPLRFCAVAVKREGRWLFHQMQFSFSTVMPPDVRYSDISQYKSKKLIRGNAPEDIQLEVRAVLKKFQGGYTKRDVSIIDGYMEELFSKDEDVFIAGTGYNENFLGFNGAKELVESDWKYWGNALINLDNAMVSSNGNTAWVTADALLQKVMTEEFYSQIYVDSMKEDLNTEMCNRGKLLHNLQGISHVLYHVSLGEKYIRPFRFTALLVKKEGKWLFKQMQFSHATTTFPDVRMIGGKPYMGYMECNW